MVKGMKHGEKVRDGRTVGGDAGIKNVMMLLEVAQGGVGVREENVSMRMILVQRRMKSG